MKKRFLSQEGLKLIACLAMLIDHIGAVFVPSDIFRVIGRIAFPVYCFLLVEGAHHTRNPKKYALRLGAGALLAELPYDLLFFGDFTLRHHSVMVTLLLGYISLQFLKRCKKPLSAIFSVIPFAILAEIFGADYGGSGVLMIHLFWITRGILHERLLQTVGLLLFMDISEYTIAVGSISIPMQVFAILSMIPISLYSGEKRTDSKLVQWIFYFFYPVHLLLIFVIGLIR